MELIADILLVSGALGAGLYCIVLSRRLSKFTNLEKGVGGAIAVLSTQVDGMTKALEVARAETTSSADSLKTLTGRAEGVAQRLELLVASLHDLPLDHPPTPAAEPRTGPKDAASKAGQPTEDELDRALFQSTRAKGEAA